MNTRIILLLALNCFFTTYAFNQSSFIHIDQFGYLPSATKVAVLSDPVNGYNAADSYTPSAMIELRDATNDAVVYTAAPSVWNSGNTQTTSGDRGWWFDFSSITATGSYYVHDPGNNESSAEFEINADVYNELLKVAGRMFYYNRCGIAKSATHAGANWADAICFTQDVNTRYIFDPTNASLEKDLSGGWFDAGDYNKYVTFAHGALHNLLWAYEENPSKFSDTWNIPESGNGIPDIIDEIKWELDFLLKMINADGSVHLKMGSQNYSDNTSAPPSANSDTRFYGPTCSSAAIAMASMLAHAAKVLDDFPALSSYAQTLETEAENTWAYALTFLNNNTLEENCDNIEIVAGDADWTAAEQREFAVVAAIHLFDLTGTADYNQYVIDNINDAEPMGNDEWDNYNITEIDALLHYTTIAGADANTSTNITNSITTAVTNNWNNYFGWSDLDLYRALIPDWSYHWGSNQQKAAFGVLNKLLNKYSINSGSSASYESRAAELLHYFHGINPQGLVYLSNMGDYGAENSINEVYHTWFADGSLWDNAQTSLYGPAPGFVPGGPNQNYTADTSLEPPYNQPSQKSYLDWNAGFPQASWEITEPAIYYQAMYLRLLSAFSEPVPLPIEWLSNPLAYASGEDVVIEWFTSAEWYNERFEVEHSLDGKHFIQLGAVQGAGNSSIQKTYSYLHKDAPRGRNYYRIKQVDYDGGFQYSIVVTAMVGPGPEVIIFPNPVNKHLNIQCKYISDYRLQLSDVHGRVLQNLSFTGQTQQLDTQKLKSGMYLLKIWDERSGFFEIKQVIK